MRTSFSIQFVEPAPFVRTAAPELKMLKQFVLNDLYSKVEYF